MAVTYLTNQKNIDSMVKNSKVGSVKNSDNVVSKSQYGPKRLTATGNNTTASGQFTDLGFLPDGDTVPSEYLVKIKTFRQKSNIVGLAQAGINMSADSIWETFIPTVYSETAEMLTQMVSGGKWSLITKATSRRKWKGSTPLSISIPLRFEAIEDAFTNVVEPCRVLQSLVLPSEGKSSEFLSNSIGYSKPLPILAPPGPTPFTLEGVLTANRSNVNSIGNEKLIEGLKGGDLIIIEFGRFLSFYNVILKRVNVEYAPKFDKLGNPISAKVNLNFETYEILTAESLNKAYEKKVPPKGA
jgi:hypothetical protein